MSGRHKGSTKAFGELSFTDQASSITARINKLQTAIEHHVEHSPRRQETIEKCLAEVDRLRQRLSNIYLQLNTHSGHGQAVPSIDEAPRIYIRSPRLAQPERAIDFIMDVAEESRDAGLR